MSAIRMQIPTATEARKAVGEGAYAKAQKQAGEVSEQIRRAISAGATQTSGDGTLVDAVENELRRLGYKVEHHSARNEDCWIVSWA